MQRLTRSYWPSARNPIGDSLKMKLQVNQAGGIVLTGGNDIRGYQILPSNIRINDPWGVLGTLSGFGGGVGPGANIAAQQFFRYRVNGFAFKIRVSPRFSPLMPLQGAGLATPVPWLRRYKIAVVCSSNATHIGNQTLTGNDTFNFPMVIPEQRWVYVRDIHEFYAGAKPTLIKGYFNVDKTIGRDLLVRGDPAYCGFTDSLQNDGFNHSATFRPSEGPTFQIIIFDAVGQPITTDTAPFDLDFQWTWYIKYFERRNNPTVQ